MPKFRDLMHAILNEDIDEEELDEEVVEEPAQIEEETFVQPVISTNMGTKVQEIESTDFAPVEQPKKPSIFDGMDIEEVSKDPVRPAPKKKEYHYDRSKISSKRRANEDLEYSPVISPIFGNTADDKKEFDKVHDAVNLQKPEEDFAFVQIISPMFGDKIPQPKPVDEIPVKTVSAQKDIELKDMLEKPKKEDSKQDQLFED